MYIVICPNNVILGRNLSLINKQLEAELKPSDFKVLGRYSVVQLDKTSLEFVKDLKIMSGIPMKNLYKKETLVPILVGLNLLLTFILLATKGG